jgi:hypothetical protein
MNMTRNSTPHLNATLTNQRGQSAVEFLVVVGALISALVAMPSAFSMVQDMLRDKYRSYSFGIAISDPPDSIFDDTVARDAAKIKKVVDTLHDVEKFIKQPSLPDVAKPTLPGKKEIDEFERILNKL